MQSVRRLLDQIEKHREKDLRDMGQELDANNTGLEIDDSKVKIATSLSNPTNQDVFAFLGSLETNKGGSSLNTTANTSGQSAV